MLYQVWSGSESDSLSRFYLSWAWNEIKTASLEGSFQAMNKKHFSEDRAPPIPMVYPRVPR